MQVDKVGLIGVKPNVSDSHIWEALALTDATIVAIGNNEAYEEWAREHRRSKPTHVAGDRFARDLGRFGDLFTS